MPVPVSRILSFEQMVIEADATYMLDRVQPEEYYFSNGRTFWHKLPYYDIPVNNIAQGLAIVNGVIAALAQTVGAASGGETSSVTGISFAFVNSYIVGAASGSATAQARSAVALSAAGHATGKGIAAAYPPGATPMDGVAVGSSEADAVAEAHVTYETVGYAEGEAVCIGISASGGLLFQVDILPLDILDLDVLGKNPIMTLNHPVDGLLDVDVLGGIVADAIAQAATQGVSIGTGTASARPVAQIAAVGQATGGSEAVAFTGQGNRGPAQAFGSGRADAVARAYATTVGSATGSAFDPGVIAVATLTAPSGLTVASATSTTITLSWNAVVDGTKPITYTAAIGPFGTGNFNELPPTTSTSVVFTGLTPSRQYTMYVFAFNGTIYSHLSPTLNGSTLAATTRPGPIKRVIVIPFENLPLSVWMGNSYFAALANKYGSALNFHGFSGTSLPSYLMETSGSNQGNTSDSFNFCQYNVTNIYDVLTANGLTYENYEESGNQDNHRHTPGYFYPSTCNSVVDMSVFMSKYMTGNAIPPNYVWVTPNFTSDAHDSNVSTASNWLQNTFKLDTLLAKSWFLDGSTLVNIFCDDGGSSAATTLNLMISTSSLGLSSSTSYVHTNNLSTVMWLLGIPGSIGSSSAASGIKTLFNTSTWTP